MIDEHDAEELRRADAFALRCHREHVAHCDPRDPDYPECDEDDRERWQALVRRAANNRSAS